MKYSYTLSYENPHRHFLDICYTISNVSQSHLKVQLPKWRPGRYELGNFAKNIQRFEVFDGNNKPLKYKKLNSHLWEINCGGASEIQCRYTYYAADLNAGSTYLSKEMLYVNPVNCLLYEVSALDIPCELQLLLAADYKVAVALPLKNEHTLIASSCHELFDSPFIASSTLQSHSFMANGKKVYLHFQGECNPPFTQLENDFSKFYLHQEAIFGHSPFAEFHFLFHLVPQAQHHGVEHQASTVIAMGPAMYQFNIAYNEFLAISSHELFHAWNIKAIRPIELTPYDYTQENYTNLGYVAEGVTTLMGDLTLLRSGVWSLETFLIEFSGEFQKHFDNFGRFNYSVAQSSYDSWLDGYSAGIPNRKVSIYTEGSLLAFIADVMICRASDFKNSLYDVMHYLYHEFYLNNKGFSEADYQFALEKFSGISFQTYFEDFIWGTKEYKDELQECLAFLGLLLLDTPSAVEHEAYLGIKLNNAGTITHIYPNGPADRAGLWVDDKIMLVNGFPREFEEQVWNDKFTSGKNQLEILRMHKVEVFEVSSDDAYYYRHYQVCEFPSDKPNENLQKWIGAKLPSKK